MNSVLVPAFSNHYALWHPHCHGDTDRHLDSRSCMATGLGMAMVMVAVVVITLSIQLF